MNKVAFYVVSLSLFGFAADAKTVKDVIRLIEKKQVQLPSYQKEKARSKSRVNIRLQNNPGDFSLIFPEGSAERNYEEKLNKEINQLNYLSKKLRSPKTKQNILMRLAKSYSEKAALIERREQNQYDKNLKLFLAGSLSKKPNLNLSESKRYNRKAVSIYEFYLKNYPKASDTDQVLFFLGYNHMGLGQLKKASEYYTRLSANYPKSDYIDEANLSLGDYYFDLDRRTSAKKYYEKVVASGRSQLKSLATYKLAWVNRKVGNHEVGLKNLLKVIRYSKKAGKRNQRALALGKEAKKDLPMFYAEAGDPRNAVTYFTNIMNRDESSKALERLAYYYVDKGDRQEAQYLFNRLIKLRPENDKSFDYQYSLVNMQSATGRGDLYEKELYKWVKDFGPNSPWARGSKDKQKVKESLKKAELALRSHVLSLHNQARKTKRKSQMARAEKGYGIYLSSFKNQEHYSEMKFYNAELLYEMGLYRQAYKSYSQVKDPKYKSKAELNAVLSLEKIIPKDAEVRLRVGKSTKEFPLSPAEKEFVTAATAYLENPKNKVQRDNVEYRLASLYYSHNYFEESEKRFKAIIQKYPNTQYAQYASNLILDSYKLKNDYAGLEKVGKELVSLGKGSSAVKVGEVKSIVEQSAFKRVEALAKKGSSAEAAEGFVGFTKSYPNSALTAEAYYNAGINYEKAGEPNKALAAYSMVPRVKGKEKLYTDAQKFSAILYDKTGYLIKAAEIYESYADGNVSASTKTKFYSNAAVIREAFNDPSGMSRVFSKLSKYDTKEKAALYDYRLAETYARIGNIKQAFLLRRDFFNRGKGESFLLINTAKNLGDYYKSVNDIGKSRYWYRASVMTYKKNLKRGAKKATSSAAASAFALTDSLFYEYLSLKIPSDAKKQSKAITRKLGLIEQINKKMVEVINYDDAATIVAALSRQGQAYQHLTFAILNTPVPKTLTAEERKEFYNILQNKVAPFKKNAITAYKKAIDKAEALDSYGSDYVNTLHELSKIDSDYASYRVPFVGAAAYSYEDFVTVEESKDIALKTAGAVLAKNPADFNALMSLARFYNQKTFTKVSQIFLDRLSASDQDKASVHNLKALNALAENKQSLALAGFKKAASVGDNLAYKVNLVSWFASEGAFKKAGVKASELYPEQALNLDAKLKNSLVNNYAVGLLIKGSVDEAVSELTSVYDANSSYLPVVGNLAIASKVIQKNEKTSNLYLGQYKKLAKSPSDFDRIKMLEKL